jgi:hypothetical protein
VGEAIGDGRACGVLVGINVGVFSGVGVAGVTIAVCVPKTEATNVPTPWVIMALTSGVGEVGTCPPHDVKKVAANNIVSKIFFALFIFTSM